MNEKKKTKGSASDAANRMPANSMFYDKMVPILLLSLGLITVILIFVAAGIFMGYIS